MGLGINYAGTGGMGIILGNSVQASSGPPYKWLYFGNVCSFHCISSSCQHDSVGDVNMKPGRCVAGTKMPYDYSVSSQGLFVLCSAESVKCSDLWHHGWCDSGTARLKDSSLKCY